MTPEQIQIALALRGVVFPPATNVKRFAESMIYLAQHRPAAELSPKQAVFLKNLAWKYRRQLPADIVRLGLKPETRERSTPLRSAMRGWQESL